MIQTNRIICSGSTLFYSALLHWTAADVVSFDFSLNQECVPLQVSNEIDLVKILYLQPLIQNKSKAMTRLLFFFFFFGLLISSSRSTGNRVRERGQTTRAGLKPGLTTELGVSV